MLVFASSFTDSLFTVDSLTSLVFFGKTRVGAEEANNDSGTDAARYDDEEEHAIMMKNT